MNSISKLRNAISNFLSGGLKGNFEDNNVRKAILINFFSVLITVGVLIFTIEHLINKRYSTVIFLLIYMTICIANLIFLRIKKKINISSLITTVFIFVLFKLVLFKFGVGDSGIYWYFLFPILAFFLLGRKPGLLFSLSTLLLAYAILKLNIDGFISYPKEYHERFALIYLLDCGSIYVFEYVREKSFLAFLDADSKKSAYLGQVISQKEQIENQSKQIQITNIALKEKNKQITDSLNYARIIQNAVLPSNESLNSAFKDYFVFYRPKDIVSGDFYWLGQKDNFTYFCTADCTGHGVPGAFMSMISNTLLNEIINNNYNPEPSFILNELNLKIFNALRQGGENSDSEGDGLDISLCRIDKASNTILFSGANQFLIICTNNEVKKISGDIHSIGSVLNKNKKINYKQYTIEFYDNSIIYFLSDGYYDQFDCNDEYTMGTDKIQSLIPEICNHPLIKQKEILIDFFEAHKGSNRQTDDVTFIGIRV